MLLERNDFSLTQETRIEHALQKLMRSKKCKTIYQLVAPEKIIDELKIKNKQIYRNIRISAAIINYVRKHNFQSSTHPDSNLLSEYYQEYLNNQIESLRYKIKQLETFCKKTDLILQSGIGNCLEMSMVGLSYCQKKYPKISAAIYTLHEGDHIFFIVGTTPRTQVICDPWSGETYPLSMATEKLQNYICYEVINVLSPFNERAQSIGLY